MLNFLKENLWNDASNTFLSKVTGLINKGQVDHNLYDGLSSFHFGLQVALYAALRGKLEAWRYVRERFGQHLTLADFRTHATAGPDASTTGLWMALNSAANHYPEVWHYVRERFGKDLTLADFRIHPTAGPDAGMSGLWEAIYSAAKSRPELWQYVLERFGKDLTLADFRTHPTAGLNANITGLWMAVFSTTHGRTELWQYVLERFGKDLTLADFRTHGLYAGITGLWMALNSAANGRPKVWQYVRERFGQDLTLADFRTHPTAGAYAGTTGFWEALCCAANGHPELWQYVRERFGKDLTLADFRTHPIAGAYSGKTGLWMVLCCAANGRPELWQYVRERFGKDLTLADFRTHPTTGPDIGKTGLWVAINSAENGRTELWQYVRECFGKDLMLADFRTHSTVEPDAGITGLWMALNSAANNYPEVWQYLRECFSKDIALADFRTHPTAGPNVGITGLWMSLVALTNGRPEMWQYVRDRFGQDLTLADFRTHPTTGADAGKPGLWVAAKAAVLGKPQVWNYIEERFIDQLTYNDIKDNDTLNLVCEALAKSPNGWSNLCKILINCNGERIAIDNILNNNKVPDTLKKLLQFYNQISELNLKIQQRQDVVDKNAEVDSSDIYAENDLLVEKANEYSVNNKSDAFYLLAKLLYRNNSNFTAAYVKSLRQVKKESPFAESAVLEIALILFTGQYDKDGNPLESNLPEAQRESAKTLAFEEALKCVTSPIESNTLKGEFNLLKRRLVGKLLLGFDDVTDPKQFSWADDINDFAILLNRITAKKYEAKISALQQQVNSLLQTQSSDPKPLVVAGQKTLLQVWNKQPQLMNKKKRTVPEENFLNVDTSSAKKARTDQLPVVSVPQEIVKEKKSENVLQEYSASILNQFSNQEVKTSGPEKVRAESTIVLDLNENRRPKRKASSSRPG